MRNLLLAATLLACPLWAQSRTQARGPHRMELSLDRQEAVGWHTIEPGLVLAEGDRVRFRFRTNFDGYLYVLDQGTSGKYELLYPRQDTGEQNRIQAGKEYVVPATKGWFRITGPPGYDVLYWMVTPLSLGSQPKYTPLPPPPPAGPAPPNLIPRCDDTIFRARGLCIDSAAGAKSVPSPERLPENMSQVPGAASRELLFIQEKEKSVVASPAPLPGPVIYEFRLAHK